VLLQNNQYPFQLKLILFISNFIVKEYFLTKKCGIDLDHGITLAGYGTLDGKDYWKCKNSWGADWGMKGYILV